MAGSPTGCPFHRDLAGRLDQAPDMAQASHRPQYLKGGEDVAGDAKAGDERMEREARRDVTTTLCSLCSVPTRTRAMLFNVQGGLGTVLG